ncbi:MULTISPECIES: hybrid sensor histidine kinase/response regulator [unclassified Variovorax]|uniref:ATP-binding response regulator n=1 Tax=unclassified Variovorax TaxID=663243 RepID=UPI002575E79C|nr:MULTISPECIES: hybrid sensor histidine kinase/response regulator [unclassified Variovorax]MDM0088240.1 hybrid sensor histidine kinase/response regulator [Variovorax sp. J22G40]MDM0146313.1 hybrid sensor histidine kinase/response regulator [Variovorax sp. J2P1-31]
MRARVPARPAGRGDDDALEQRVLREHVASVYYIYNATLVSRVVFILLLGGFLYLQLRSPAVLAFVGIHLALYAYLAFAPRWTPAAPAADSPRWVRRITVTVTLMGLADAMAPWLFVPAGNIAVTAVLMVVMLGNCARAVQSLRPLTVAMYGHTLPMLGGLIAALIVHGDGMHWFLAAFATVNLTLMLRVGVQEHRQLTDALLLRFENEALAARLSEQVAATERASAEKTRFLTTASHDLRQPLHAVALFGAALETALQDRPEGRNAERLMRAVNALGKSLDTMLDVSRLDAGVVTPTFQPVQIDALLLSLNHVFSAQAEQKDLQLRLRASGLWVHSDPQLLARMLSNLIDNAVKYTQRGGVTVTARAHGRTVRIDVLDTGAGIAPDQRDRIFEEFYQVGNSGRDRARGLGIGLSIVQRLSRLLGHPVELRSRIGRGSRFRISLPLAEARARVAQAARAAGSLPRRVLLIDDEADIREAMTVLLRAWSIEVMAVGDEQGAIDALSRARVPSQQADMLICDYRLPEGANGLDVGLRLHRRFGIERPLLLITGETAPEPLRHARESGVPMLFKPVNAAALRRALTSET